MTFSYALLFWLTLVVYALAVGAQIAGQVFRSPRFTRWAQRLVLAGLAVHTVLVAWRWISSGHLPAIGNFENALLGGWFIVAMTAWAAHRERYPLLAAASLPFALLVLGARWDFISRSLVAPAMQKIDRPGGSRRDVNSW